VVLDRGSQVTLGGADDSVRRKPGRSSSGDATRLVEDKGQCLRVVAPEGPYLDFTDVSVRERSIVHPSSSGNRAIARDAATNAPGFAVLAIGDSAIGLIQTLDHS